MSGSNACVVNRTAANGESCCLLCGNSVHCVYEGRDLQDIENPYIGCASARKSPCTWKECLRSVFELHNETFNIWSHFIGGLYFAKAAHTGPLPARVSAGSSAITYFVSAIAHTFGARSPWWSDVLFRFDRSGIANFLYSATVAVSLVHYREPKQKSARTLAVSLSTLIYAGSLHSFIFLNTRDKVKSVGLLAIQSILGTLVCLAEMGTTKKKTVKRLVSRYLPGATGSALLGAILFVSYVPERYKRRWFDYFGNSHNIMHVLVLWSSRDAYVGMTKWCREVGYV